MQRQSAPPTVTDYYAQLDSLRQQEDKLFQLALANPQETHLAQFESIWNHRNAIHQAIKNTMTPLPTESTQAPETQEHSTFTVEELKAIPKMNVYDSELIGKLFYSLDNRPQLCKKFKLPRIVVERYKLTPRQANILEGKLRIAPQIEDMPNRHHDYADSNDYPLSSSLAVGYYWQSSGTCTMGRY